MGIGLTCHAFTVQRTDFAWASLRTTDQGGTIRTEVWRPDAPLPDKSEVVVMNVAVRNQGLFGAMEFEIAILINGSLESAGRRATLFSRLIDEHIVIDLPGCGKGVPSSDI